MISGERRPRVSGSSGVGANRNLVQGNYHRGRAWGGYRFGTGNPGNGATASGSRTDRRTRSAASTADLGNAIASNDGAGVYITGHGAPGNTVANNLIGLTADGRADPGQCRPRACAIYSPSNTIGPGNVISGNLRGIGIYGPGASTPGTATGITGLSTT